MSRRYFGPREADQGVSDWECLRLFLPGHKEYERSLAAAHRVVDSAANLGLSKAQIRELLLGSSDVEFCYHQGKYLPIVANNAVIIFDLAQSLTCERVGSFYVSNECYLEFDAPREAIAGLVAVFENRKLIVDYAIDPDNAEYGNSPPLVHVDYTSSPSRRLVARANKTIFIDETMRPKNEIYDNLYHFKKTLIRVAERHAQRFYISELPGRPKTGKQALRLLEAN